jgi:hypothetical protein
MRSDVQEIRRRALELAETGQCNGWQFVEMKLRQEGFEGVISALGDDVIRQELDEACRQAGAKMS